MSEVAASDEPGTVVAPEPGSVDLFPELADGADLGVIEYVPPGSAEAVELLGEASTGAA
jgi:hypothetical protein